MSAMNSLMSDELTWDFLDKGTCSYKYKTNKINYCKNEYNVTGLCQKSSCPLANSIYATVREYDNKIYLMIKVPERANQPAKLWKRVELGMKEEEAKKLIKENLNIYTSWIKQKCARRYEKLHTYVKNKLKAPKQKETLIPIKRKIEKQEKIRSHKAFLKSNLHKTIQKELDQRLKEGHYGEMYKEQMESKEIIDKESQAQDLDSEELSDEFYAGELSDSDLEYDIEDLSQIYSTLKSKNVDQSDLENLANESVTTVKKRTQPPRVSKAKKKIKQSVNE